MSKGDFWCTRTVDLCLFADGACDSVTGENDATVGGFGSPLTSCCWPSSCLLDVVVEDMRSSHGVSLSCR